MKFADDWNRWSMVSEATALPTEPQTRSKKWLNSDHNAKIDASMANILNNLLLLPKPPNTPN